MAEKILANGGGWTIRVKVRRKTKVFSCRSQQAFEKTEDWIERIPEAAAPSLAVSG